MKKEVSRVFPGPREDADTHVMLTADKMSGGGYLVKVGYTYRGGVPTSWAGLSLTAEAIEELAPMLSELTK